MKGAKQSRCGLVARRAQAVRDRARSLVYLGAITSAVCAGAAALWNQPMAAGPDPGGVPEIVQRHGGPSTSATFQPLVRRAVADLTLVLPFVADRLSLTVTASKTMAAATDSEWRVIVTEGLLERIAQQPEEGTRRSMLVFLVGHEVAHNLTARGACDRKPPPLPENAEQGADAFGGLVVQALNLPELGPQTVFHILKQDAGNREVARHGEPAARQKAWENQRDMIRAQAILFREAARDIESGEQARIRAAERKLLSVEEAFQQAGLPPLPVMRLALAQAYHRVWLAVETRPEDLMVQAAVYVPSFMTGTRGAPTRIPGISRLYSKAKYEYDAYLGCFPEDRSAHLNRGLLWMYDDAKASKLRALRHQLRQERFTSAQDLNNLALTYLLEPLRKNEKSADVGVASELLERAYATARSANRGTDLEARILYNLHVLYRLQGDTPRVREFGRLYLGHPRRISDWAALVRAFLDPRAAVSERPESRGSAPPRVTGIGGLKLCAPERDLHEYAKREGLAAAKSAQVGYGTRYTLSHRAAVRFRVRTMDGKLVFIEMLHEKAGTILGVSIGTRKAEVLSRLGEPQTPPSGNFRYRDRNLIIRFEPSDGEDRVSAIEIEPTSVPPCPK